MRAIDIVVSALKPFGYTSTELKFGSEQKSFTLIQQAGVSLTMESSCPLYPFATASARLISKNKKYAYELMSLQGINVPKTVYLTAASALDDAERLLTECSTLITKPLDSAGSSGLTLNITTKDQLENAVENAKRHSDEVVVQQQFSGEEIRFPVVNGKVAAAILRQKPRIVGDGYSTVSTLIEEENTKRATIADTMVKYPLLDDSLIQLAGIDREYVPKKDEVLELNKNTMIRGGASIYNVLDTIHPSYIQIAEQAANVLGKGFVVVDIMITDYKAPANEDNYVFIEFNMSPALRLFYSCRDGKHFRVAEEHLAPLIDATLQETPSKRIDEAAMLTDSTVG